MDQITAASVTGSDGSVPIYDPEGRWQIWALSEIYLGHEGRNRYVPKINDHVVNYETDERYRVIDLDQVTLIPRLEKIIVKPTGGDFTEDDLLLGVGPGTASDTYRVYVDRSVRPFVMAVDARLSVKGSMCSTAMIFKGANLGIDGRCISAVYDQTGNLLGNSIPLELVRDPDLANRTEKTVPPCHTIEPLEDNEIVTAVFYSDNGHVVSKRQLLVENTAFIRGPDASRRYVTGIYMKTPFLSTSNPNVVEYPINVPVRGFNLMGVVQYSDGSEAEMPVDGTKFQIQGLHDYVATVPGMRIPTYLKYTLSESEAAYGVKVNDGYFINERYEFVTMSEDGSYSVKLFGYPVWIDELHGYRLEWFLSNLDRSAIYNVTPYVRINGNSAPLDPTAYGVAQRISVSINLRDANGLYKDYLHTQVLDFVLVRKGTDHMGTKWTVGFELGQSPQYGKDNRALMYFVNANMKKFDISLGEKTVETWLDRLFYLTKPLFTQADGERAPAPNMFNVIVGSKKMEYTIENWNQQIVYNGLLNDGATIYVEFFKRTPENDIFLGVSGIPVQQVS